jgi:FAD/FMN-containing dehydrogenase
MIDLSGMRGVSVDAEKRTARVAGGATWRDVDAASQAHGLATPGGLISDTGVAGLTLSGGIGWLRSRHGLCIDNMLSVEIVTADGQVRRASEQENADLFWAVRGGGGNFGVITEFEFQLYPLGPEVMFCAPIYALDCGAEPIRFWRDFLADKSDRIGSLLEFSTVRRRGRRACDAASARARATGNRFLRPHGLPRSAATVRYADAGRAVPLLLEIALPQ